MSIISAVIYTNMGQDDSFKPRRKISFKETIRCVYTLSPAAIAKQHQNSYMPTNLENLKMVLVW